MALYKVPPRSPLARRWRRFRWSILVALYALCCTIAVYPSMPLEPQRTQMGWLILGFFCFAMGFFQFFYAIANFSTTARWKQQQLLKKPPPHPFWIAFHLFFATLCISILLLR